MMLIQKVGRKRIRKQIPTLIDKLTNIATNEEGSKSTLKSMHLELKEQLRREGKPGRGMVQFKN